MNPIPTRTPPPLTPTQIPHTLTPAHTVTPVPQSNVAPSENATRITFESGNTSTTNSDALPAGGAKEYILSVTAGQTLHIQTIGYHAPVEFTLQSPGGTIWSGEPGASEVYIFTSQVVLPEDGDYIVTLSVPLDKGATRYDVLFTIIPSLLPTIPVAIESPQRVEFAPGTSSAMQSSLLPSGLSVKQYVLAASDGQTMTINITSDDVPVSLTIISPSGIQYFSEAILVDDGYRASHSFTLAETGDYLMTLIKAEHTPSTNYTVEITIQ